MTAEHKGYNIYRGLQRPFKLFGLSGINIAWGFGGAGVAFLLLILFYSLFGMLSGLLAAAVVAGVSVYKVRYHIKYGLHNKNRMKGVWVVKNLIKPTYRG